MAKENGEMNILCLRLKCAGATYLELQKIGRGRDEQELKTGKYGIKQRVNLGNEEIRKAEGEKKAAEE